jgi:hypothetical protein
MIFAMSPGINGMTLVKKAAFIGRNIKRHAMPAHDEGQQANGPKIWMGFEHTKTLDGLGVHVYFEAMKDITISIDEDLYRSAQQRVADIEGLINQQVADYLKCLNGDDEKIAVARERMAELFGDTKGFGVGERPSREEMHERGSVR